MRSVTFSPYRRVCVVSLSPICFVGQSPRSLSLARFDRSKRGESPKITLKLQRRVKIARDSRRIFSSPRAHSSAECGHIHRHKQSIKLWPTMTIARRSDYFNCSPPPMQCIRFIATICEYFPKFFFSRQASKWLLAPETNKSWIWMKATHFTRTIKKNVYQRQRNLSV